MDQEIKNEFEELARMVAEGFQSVEERMATKEDLKNFATKDDLKRLENNMATMENNMATKADLKILENKMDDGFSSVRSELKNEISDVRRDIKDLREEVKNNFKTETEDVGAVYKDIEDLKKRMVLAEARP